MHPLGPTGYSTGRYRFAILDQECARNTHVSKDDSSHEKSTPKERVQIYDRCGFAPLRLVRLLCLDKSDYLSRDKTARFPAVDRRAFRRQPFPTPTKPTTALFSFLFNHKQNLLHTFRASSFIISYTNQVKMDAPMEPPQAVGGGVDPFASNFVQVLCCVCGISIAPNAANTCATCLASTADITKGISTEVTLHQCRSCQRWHKEEGKWMSCGLESRELMALCLGNISGLKNSKKEGSKVRLVDASWIWTEPHSMRLKVRLTIQREVEMGTILQQAFTVAFIVRNQQCVECQSEFRAGSWRSLVQVRQRVAHKRTFLYLEQLILKHGSHRGCLSIEVFQDGMDFYFPDKGKANRFISFLDNVVPSKVGDTRMEL
jgi:hypothetical protein